MTVVPVVVRQAALLEEDGVGHQRPAELGTAALKPVAVVEHIAATSRGGRPA